MDLWQRFADGWRDGLFAFDSELRVVAANAAAGALFGVPVAGLIGRRIGALSPAAAGQLDPLVARAFDELNVFVNDLRPFAADEPYSALTHRLAGDDAVAAVALTLHRERDGDWSTDDGWAHRELRFANRLLRACTGSTSLGFIRRDCQGRVVEWSARAAEIFGWSFEEARGRTIDELGLIAPAGAPDDAEVRSLTRDGRTIHCHWFDSTIEIDESHQVVSLVEDVTAVVESRVAALESEQRFRSLFEYSPDAMFALSLTGIITRANAAAAHDHGYPLDALIGMPGIALLVPGDGDAAVAMHQQAAAGASPTGEFTALRADGSSYPVLATMSPIVFGGRIAGVHLLARDLTAIRRVESELAAQSDRLRELYLVAAAANATSESIIGATIDAGCRLLGLSSGALYDLDAGRSVASVGRPIPPRVARLPIGAAGALALEDAPGAFVGTAVEVAGVTFGTLYFADESPRGSPFSAGDRDLVQLMGALVGSAIERGRVRARLNHLAYNDQLTALPNRAWVTERLRDDLARASQAGTRLAVMFLDLDRFKDINDTLGHAVGDRMLRVIGDRLGDVVGDAGVVARMGGDEFIVLVGGDPAPQQLHVLAQQIVEAVDQPLLLDGYEQYVTTSIGIALYPRDGDDADALIKHADVAMYRAKERGRNTYQFFTAELGARLQMRISQEKSLRKALERDEFVLHYQPQFKLDDERPCSLEALVRWQHPRLGLVGPDTFIPSAEMSGLIVALGDWVLETACRQVRSWQRFVPGVRLAVNLSARQFHHAGLVAKISDVLARTGLAPDDLEIEITESDAMSDAALSVQILEELRRAGVRLAVDDFGTGYSSLGYLRRFPLDTLKIDKSFVRAMMTDEGDATIVRTVIGMAHSLGLEVCAEGVETAEQLAFLRSERCDRVQGFLQARPLPADQALAFLMSRGNHAQAG